MRPARPFSLRRVVFGLAVLSLTVTGCRPYADPIGATLTDRDGTQLGPVSLYVVADLSGSRHLLTVTLPDGETFDGTLIDAMQERMIPGPPGDGPEYVPYRETATGTLYAPGNAQVALSCRLRYRDPFTGMAAGGRGECHTNDDRHFVFVL